VNQFLRIGPPLWAAALLALATILAATAASAASQYDIEVVVFEYIVPDVSGEFWPPDPGFPRKLSGSPCGSFRMGFRR